MCVREDEEKGRDRRERKGGTEGRERKGQEGEVR